jgi:GxxExxY protein
VARDGPLVEQKLTERVIGCAIEVHRVLGPGLLESAYESCLCHEFERAEIRFERQVELPIQYKAHVVESAFRIDLLVEGTVVVELKAIDKLLPIHDAQLLTYLRLSEKRVGLLLNFNVTKLMDGLVRRVR